MTENERSRTLEGACRPGHFEAVLTIVLKLLQIADAERAYFGEKDWQQLELVRDMAAAFFLRTDIVSMRHDSRARRSRPELTKPAAGSN